MCITISPEVREGNREQADTYIHDVRLYTETAEWSAQLVHQRVSALFVVIVTIS